MPSGDSAIWIHDTAGTGIIDAKVNSNFLCYRSIIKNGSFSLFVEKADRYVQFSKHTVMK